MPGPVPIGNCRAGLEAGGEWISPPLFSERICVELMLFFPELFGRSRRGGL